MTFKRESVHHAVFLFGMAVMVVGLAVSLFLISIGGMILAANWLAEAGFASKMRRLKSNTPALLLLGLFFLHLIWLWNTQNFDYAFKDIRIKLPLLFLPIILGSQKAMKHKVLFQLLWVLVAALILGTIMSIVHYFTAHEIGVDNIREIIFFSSPIRFSLLLVLAIAFAFYNFRTKRIPWWGFGVIFLWLIGFMVFLQSVTGLLMLLAITAVLLIYYGWVHVAKPTGWALVVIPIFFILGLSAFVVGGYFQFLNPANSPENTAPLEEFSSGGEAYVHRPENTEIQNGHYIYRYMAFGELERGWNRLSEMRFGGEDQRGQELRYTLVRYMASMGLRKDSVGLTELTAQDVDRIEKGYTSANPPENPMVRRLQGIYYEINAYFNGASAQGSSLIQRIVYLQTGWGAASQNWLLGVGTGDVNDVMLSQYDSDGSSLDMDHRRRAHNQYLTFLISFGIIGAGYFLFLNFYSIWLVIKRANFMGIAFVFIAALSFLAEDTLETQVGATFYAFFFAVLLCMKTTDSAGEQFRFDELWRNPVDSRLHK